MNDELCAVIAACEVAAKARHAATQRTPTQAEYEARERSDLMATLRDVETQSLADRREALSDWTLALTSYAGDGVTNLVAERVGWLLNGSYGKGSYDQAWAIVGNTRLNRVAGLAQLIAALEWRCPQRFAVQGWAVLDLPRRDAVNACIQAEIDAAVAEREAGV